jgi:hypothetical protein
VNYLGEFNCSERCRILAHHLEFYVRDEEYNQSSWVKGRNLSLEFQKARRFDPAVHRCGCAGGHGTSVFQDLELVVGNWSTVATLRLFGHATYVEGLGAAFGLNAGDAWNLFGPQPGNRTRKEQVRLLRRHARRLAAQERLR